MPPQQADLLVLQTPLFSWRRLAANHDAADAAADAPGCWRHLHHQADKRNILNNVVIQIFSTRQSTDPGATSSLPCVFPFTHLGIQHDACTVAGHPEGLAWCSTRAEGGRHVEGGGHWGLCGSSCPQETTCPKGWTHLPTGCYLLDTQVFNNTLTGSLPHLKASGLVKLTTPYPAGYKELPHHALPLCICLEAFFHYWVLPCLGSLASGSCDIEDAMQGQGEPWRSGLPPFFANLGSGLFV